MKEFFDALFQLVDVWCEQSESMELFVVFLQRLFENIAEYDPISQTFR